MKKIFFVLLTALITACNSNNFDNLFTESTSFPYVIDSAFFATFSQNETFKPLEGEYLKQLYRDVETNDKSLNEYTLNMNILIDSLKKSGVSDEKIKEEYSDFITGGLKALHKFKLGSDITVYTWYIYESADPNQGADMVYATVFKGDSASSSFLLAERASFSDSPMWSVSNKTGVIDEDGKVLIQSYVAEGENIETPEGKWKNEIENATKTKIEFSIISGKIENSHTEDIGSYTRKEASLEPIPLNEFQKKFTKKTLPAELDSVFIDKAGKGGSPKLSVGEVITLTPKVEELANTHVTGTIRDFVKIDSLKQVGKYEEYVQNIDMAETETSDSYALAVYKLPDESQVFIWAIVDRTSISGPWSEGTILLASFVKDGKVLACYSFAEVSFGGDAPVWGAAKTECTITDSGEFKISYQYLNGDDDAGTVDKSTDFFNYIWKNGTLEKIPESE